MGNQHEIDTAVLREAVKDVTERCVKLSLEHALDRERVFAALRLLIYARLEINGSDVRKAFEEAEWWGNTAEKIGWLYDDLKEFLAAEPKFTQDDLAQWKQRAQLT